MHSSLEPSLPVLVVSGPPSASDIVSALKNPVGQVHEAQTRPQAVTVTVASGLELMLGQVKVLQFITPQLVE